MKLLMIAPYPIFPTNDGGRVRIRQIATHLSAHHEVHVTAPVSPAGVEQAPFAFHASPKGGVAQMVDPRTFGHLRSLMSDLRPDAVLLEYMWLAPHIAPLAARAGVSVLLDKPDVDTVRFRRAGRRIWPLVSAYERIALRLARRVYATSDVDRRGLIDLGAAASNTSVVPNGVDTSVYRLADPAKREATRRALGLRECDTMLFFFGQLSYAPNSEAIRTIATLMPALPDTFRLFVAGRGPTDHLVREFGSSRVTFLGAVDAIAPLLQAADVVPALVTHGSGTRLKILESVACGVPTVTTPVGAEGLDLAVCGDALRIVDNVHDAADAIVMAAAAAHVAPSRAFVEAHDWKAIVSNMELAA